MESFALDLEWSAMAMLRKIVMMGTPAHLMRLPVRKMSANAIGLLLKMAWNVKQTQKHVPREIVVLLVRARPVLPFRLLAISRASSLFVSMALFRRRN
jgi:hypothetical protein